VRRRKVIAVVVLVLGVLLLAGAMADHSFASPRNAECQSGLGQLGQIIDTTVAHDCGLVGALEAATGWLILLGVAALGAGVYLARAAYSRSASSSSDRTPPGGRSPSRTI
jgi:hypothetical protein